MFLFVVYGTYTLPIKHITIAHMVTAICTQLFILRGLVVYRSNLELKYISVFLTQGLHLRVNNFSCLTLGDRRLFLS